MKISNYEKSLDRLRKEIDRIDNDLVRALAHRMRIVKKIGLLKKKHGQPVLQSKRFGQMLISRVGSAWRQGLDKEFAVRWLKLIHSEAIRIQKKQRK